MCGRYAFTLPHEAMIRLFRVPWFAPYPPRYNIAPTQPILAVRASPNGREAFLVRWGLVPNWVKDPRDFPLVINARAETLLEKPAFRGAIRHHRCLIPASGYYEWQKTSSGKVPHYITRADGEPMALAGLYETWEGPDGNIIDTAAIVTVAASPDMAHLHDRTPAMLEPDLWDAWLDTSSGLPNIAMPLLHTLPDGVLTAHPVSTRVNAVTNDDPGLIEPASAQKPAPSKKAQMDLF